MAAQAFDGLIALFAFIVLDAAYRPLGVLVILAFLLKDALPYASPGKTCLRLRVFTKKTNRPCSLRGSLLRNLLLLPPLGIVDALILAFSHDGHRLGDIVAGTFVAAQDFTPQSQAITAPAENTTCESPPAPSASLPSEADAKDILGLLADAGEDEVEEAFWCFAERYSSDATRSLADEELYQRAGELAQRCGSSARTSFRLPAPLQRAASREEAQAYINAHVVAVNGARDHLLG